MSVAVQQRATRSHDTPAYNSDSPRKRTRYSGAAVNGSRRSSLSLTGRGGLRTPRADPEQEDEAALVTPARRGRRAASPDKPRYNSAADAAAAATGQIDGYKPREERSWEEFHQDLSLESQIAVFSAEEVDGLGHNDDDIAANASLAHDSKVTNADPETVTPSPRRRPGRPPRRPESMLNGLGSPTAPRLAPLPPRGPQEKLNLPKPSYRQVNTFKAFEEDPDINVNYVDRGLANVGFQEYETFVRSGQHFLRHIVESGQDDREHPPPPDKKKKGDKNQAPQVPQASRVEYDMDEQDEQWLLVHNHQREKEQVEGIKPPVFEITMTQIEKEWHALERRIPKPNPKPPQTHRPRSSSAAAVKGDNVPAGEEQDSKCAICDDGDCENSNAIVFCDGCELAVHQECYGVPFIPEGQWYCRKCQLLGNSKPVCIFCPNQDGAFKQTSENRWAHLVCATWIPEVTIANTVYQEPIGDVKAVPKDRWNRLICYICNQQMGACIQCGHKSCYVAFHVTCAKKAKLYLRQKSSHGAGPSMDTSVLKAMCHKHVPDAWRETYNPTHEVAKAQRFYRKRMKNIQWADSQTAAITAVASQSLNPLDLLDASADGEDAKGQANAAALKKKRLQAQKNVWKLQSGAPIVPEVVLDAIEASLVRFGVRKRREFVAEACKYWTMKRDSRRGAAMLKRLQLQLEAFSANEVTRRNFAAMGPIGATRLDRRIEMAERLLEELATTRGLCEQVKAREENKLQDADVLRGVVDSVYFPISNLVEPIVSKVWSTITNASAESLFRPVMLASLAVVQKRVDQRLYGCVADFAVDMGQVYNHLPGLEDARDVIEALNMLTASSLKEEQLETNDKKFKGAIKLAVKKTQQLLANAFMKEAELDSEDHSDRLQHFRTLAEKDYGQFITFGKPHAMDVDTHSANGLEPPEIALTNGDVNMHGTEMDVDNAEQDQAKDQQPQEDGDQTQAAGVPGVPDSEESLQGPAEALNGVDAFAHELADYANKASGPDVEGEDAGANESTSSPLEGLPWYMRQFEPHGTSFQEEKWTGLEVLRDMSEELSEMDEEELQGLGPSSEASEERTPDAASMNKSRRSRRQR